MVARQLRMGMCHCHRPSPEVQVACRSTVDSSGFAAGKFFEGFGPLQA